MATRKAEPERAPPRRIEYVALGDVKRAARNAKAHDVPRIRALIEEFGFVDSAVHDDRTDKIIAGHGRLEALEQMAAEGQSPPDGIVARPDGVWTMPVEYGWSSRSDAQAEALGIALNESTIRGGWDDRILTEALRDLENIDAELREITGFTMPDLEALQAGHTDDKTDYESEEFKNTPPSVLLADPAHEVKQGEVYRLDRHVLVVGKATTDWPLWLPHLTGDAVFCAHPSPYLPLSSLARTRPLVMVTSSAYLAGHVLDKWADAGYAIEAVP